MKEIRLAKNRAVPAGTDLSNARDPGRMIPDQSQGLFG
jgi:hypothetical protein